MLDRGNLFLVDYALGHLSGNAPFLEIGSFCGLSANLITHYKRKHGLTNKLFTCDKWEWTLDFGEEADNKIAGSPVLFSDYRRFTRDSYLRSIRTFSADDPPFTIEAFSAEFFELWGSQAVVEDVLGRSVGLGGPLSFCYVDGDHSYAAAKRDFENCDAFLEVGGFILFDDSTLKTYGVHQLMPEVAATGRYKLVARNPNHLFQRISK